MENQLVKLFLFILSSQLTLATVEASNVNWSKNHPITSPRENLYELPPRDYEDTLIRGRRHVLFYPVDISYLRLPYEPLKYFFETAPDDPVRKVIFELAKIVSPFRSMNELYKWLGLHDFPKTIQPETPNPFPELSVHERELPMGATIFETEEGKGITFGCATCHTSDLFGVKVLGLTNRYPRANEFFKKGTDIGPYINTFLFKDLLHATEGERLILVKAKKNLKFVETKVPVVLGLDTSLAQVALSLAKRKDDAYATRTDFHARFPRENKLEKMISDSKPAVWWNLKYKNRWLADGSIVSGNPVHTNILWNELGRGTDLKELEQWLQTNEKKIQDLTAAVFATKAPRYEKFFGDHAINLERARRGQKLFVQSCQKCHGVYEKGWNLPGGENLSVNEQIQNVKVTYPEQTPVRDVGTDPGRYLGMKEFSADLNRLAISKAIGVLVEPQKGYVPPPLVGIWSRWPYFHNNSIPNLCALLTPGKGRPVSYYSGPANNRETDFDQDCVGYPLGSKTPAAWKKNPEYLYDSRKEGLSNKGHDERIFIKDGIEIFTKSDKQDLIEFLKTL